VVMVAPIGAGTHAFQVPAGVLPSHWQGVEHRPAREMGTPHVVLR
jgi:hypothetical protein